MNTRRNSPAHVLVTAGLARSIQKVMDEENRADKMTGPFVNMLIVDFALHVVKTCKELPEAKPERFDEIMDDYGRRYSKFFGGHLDDDLCV